MTDTGLQPRSDAEARGRLREALLALPTTYRWPNDKRPGDWYVNLDDALDLMVGPVREAHAGGLQAGPAALAYEDHMPTFNPTPTPRPLSSAPRPTPSAKDVALAHDQDLRLSRPGGDRPSGSGLHLTVATVIPALRSSTDPNVKDAYERLHAALSGSSDPEASRWPQSTPTSGGLDVERLAAAMYNDGCIAPPRTDHVQHVLAALTEAKPESPAPARRSRRTLTDLRDEAERRGITWWDETWTRADFEAALAKPESPA